MNLTQVYASRIAEELASELHGRKLVDYETGERIVDGITERIAKLLVEYLEDNGKQAPPPDPFDMRSFFSPSWLPKSGLIDAMPDRIVEMPPASAPDEETKKRYDAHKKRAPKWRIPFE